MIHRKWVRRLKHLFEPKAIVLMYHRVADLPADPWQLAVQPAHFEQQLKVLCKKFKVIPLQELVNKLNSRSVEANTVCITFDDGYRDNFLHAMPLLEKYACPATFFITTQYVDRKQLFWWDELQHLLLDPPELPGQLDMDIGGVPFSYQLQEDATLSARRAALQKTWVAPENPPTRRCELYFKLWEQLKPLPEAELQDMLLKVRVWTHYCPQPEKESWPLTTTQLKRIACHPLFDIGLHTVTHASLSVQPEEIQSQEIMENRVSLKKICHHCVDMITYPYGDYNDTTISVVIRENLTAAFSTAEKVITKQSNPYCLGRFQVKDWSSRKFESQLAHWSKTY